MNLSNEQIVAALLECRTNKEAAAKLGISESALYKRQRNAAFRACYQNANLSLLQHSIMESRTNAFAALRNLQEIADNKDLPAQVRVNACDSLIRNHCKLESIAEKLDVTAAAAHQEGDFFSVFDNIDDLLELREV